MKRLFHVAGSLILAGAITAPIAMQAQDHDRDDRDKDRDRDRNNNARIYDREHRDYHNWNSDEDSRYRQWYTSTYNGRQYRNYNKLHKKDQQAYWNWRHSQRDNDHDRDDRH